MKNQVKPPRSTGTSGQRFAMARSRRSGLLRLFLIVGVASLLVRLLLNWGFGHSALLYVATPYLISLAIIAFYPLHTADRWWTSWINHIVIALAVFLASSIVLFEGFICVLFFMPIYFAVVCVGFLLAWIKHKTAQRTDRLRVSFVPLLILVVSLEGTHPNLTFERDAHVVVTRTVQISAAQIMQNIRQPVALEKERSGMLSVFPMPYRVDAPALEPGAVHTIHTRYKRWFFTNVHEGQMTLEIVHVDDTNVRTRFLHDSTYFASYLQPKGTHIHLQPLDNGLTQISLRIDYRRKLDPAWYFHPLQQAGVTQMGEFLIEEIMIRE